MTDSAVSKTYRVRGMSCEHCRSSLIEEVSELDGVDAVEVDLATGRLEVSGADFTDGDVAVAVDAAGYELEALR